MTGSGGSVASFSVWDYVVFAGIIVGASGIGLWQAIRSRKEKTSEEFLLGGRQMHAVPVAMSLTASFMSGITVIGTPAESYCYGTAFWLFGLTYFIMSTITAELFVPFFYRLGMTSVYEYLEMRFSKSVRALATTIFVMQTIVYTGLVLYAPAVALNLITGMNLWGVLVLTGVVCIIYCTVGGLKAVIWTDAVQLVIMLAGFGAVIAKGAVIQGGLAKIWKDAEDGGRLDAIDFDLDPLKRHTFWTILVGGTVLWLSLYSINQAQVQRYLACRSLAHAKMSLYLNYLGLLATVSLAMFSGLVMYSIYMHCDPLTNNDVGATDQLLPYLVMDILGAHPGVPGLFVAAAYSGTLSTVSSSINALVAVSVEDFIRPKWKNLTEQQLSWISMSLSVFFGAVCIGMSGVASLMGSVLQAALSIIGILGGPLLGLFFLGMLFRTSNSIGAVTGLLTGLALTMWVGIGAQIYPPTDKKTNILLFGVNCTNSTGDYNMTSPAPWTSAGTSEPLVRPHLADTWYSLSYLYFCPLGVLCTIAMGLLVSLSTGGYKQENLDSNLFVRKSDLICFNFRSNGSKMLDMEHEHKDDLEKTQERFDSYHKFDTTEKHEDKDTRF